MKQEKIIGDDAPVENFGGQKFFLCHEHRPFFFRCAPRDDGYAQRERRGATKG